MKTQKYFKKLEKNEVGGCRICITSETEFQKKRKLLSTGLAWNAKTNGWDCTTSNMMAGEGSFPFVSVTAAVNKRKSNVKL